MKRRVLRKVLKFQGSSRVQISAGERKSGDEFAPGVDGQVDPQGELSRFRFFKSLAAAALATSSLANLVVFVCSFGFASSAQAEANDVSRMRFHTYNVNAACELRVGIQSPARTPAADVFFFHGFGDRMDNHQPLFRELVAQGIRVVSFDQPSHGLSRCDRLNLFSPQTLAQAAAGIERANRESATRPLILVGWSTGGLLALRTAQLNLIDRRPVNGLILLAPALWQPTFVNGDSFIRNSTLTRNRSIQRAGPIVPASPMYTPLFTARMVQEGEVAAAATATLPNSLPIFIALAGDQDAYVQTPRVREWALGLRTNGKRMAGLQCTNALHELDNEIDPVGAHIRKTVATVSAWIASGAEGEPALEASRACPAL